MNNFLLGDVPEKDRETAEELQKFEPQIDSGTFSPKTKAKMYVCIAHDWYQMGLEDEGRRLLEKAEDACPRYFEDVMLKQASDDPAFTIIVRGIARELVLLLLDEVKQKRD